MVLTLVGKELTDLKKSEDDFGVAPTDTYEFFSGKVVLKQFEGHVCPAGQNYYEFELLIPEWLPTSTLHNTEYAFQLKTCYELWAQVMPAVKSDRNAGGFRDMKEIFIGDMPRPIPLVNINESIVSKVGGMMGLGAKESKLDIHLDQNQYYNGDTCTVKLVCDNKESSVPVKSFKLKLKRKVFAAALDRNSKKEVKIKDSRYIYQHKDADFKVKAGKKEEGQI